MDFSKLMGDSSLTFDLGSLCSSGYGTAVQSPEEEAFPFDIDMDSLVDRLTSLETDDHRPICGSLFLCPAPADFKVQTTCTVYVISSSGAAVDLSKLSIVIRGPSYYDCEVSEFTFLSDRVVCSFRPLEPGCYVVSVFYNEVYHIVGSPSHLYVSRDYRQPISRPIVHFDVEIKDPPAPAPAVQDEPRTTSRKPWGICQNTKTEQMFVADREQHQVLVYGPDGELNFTFGSQGTAAGHFFRPTALAYDGVGDRILISDKDNHRIQIFNPQGQFLSSFGSRGIRQGQFMFPWGVAVSPDGGYIAVADTRNHRIQLFDAAGKYIRQFRVHHGKYSKECKSLFDYPRGIAFSLNGQQLYVTDFNLHTVFEVDLDFQSYRSLVAPGILLRPSGIAVDPVGNLLVCNNRKHSVEIFTPTGQHLVSLHNIAGSRLELPVDVAILKGGFVAIHDFNGRIRIV